MFLIQGLFVLVAIGFFLFQLKNSFIKDSAGVVNGIRPVKVLWSLAVSLAIVFVMVPSFGTIQAGNKGVVLYLGDNTGKTFDPGPYFLIPFVESVHIMNCQVHAEATKATAASRDLQIVTTEVTVNYRLNRNKVAEVYGDLGDEYWSRVGVPAVQEAIKAATAQFDAENLIRERPRVKDEIDRFLQTRLTQHGMIVDGISITNFAFSEDFESAIEAKVTATQLAMAAENKLREVKAQAQQQIETAKAGAEAIRIQANAINAQGGQDYVSLKAIEKWDGSVPQWMGGGQPVPFVNMKLPERRSTER